MNSEEKSCLANLFTELGDIVAKTVEVLREVTEHGAKLSAKDRMRLVSALEPLDRRAWRARFALHLVVGDFGPSLDQALQQLEVEPDLDTLEMLNRVRDRALLELSGDAREAWLRIIDTHREDVQVAIRRVDSREQTEARPDRKKRTRATTKLRSR